MEMNAIYTVKMNPALSGRYGLLVSSIPGRCPSLTNFCPSGKDWNDNALLNIARWHIMPMNNYAIGNRYGIKLPERQ
jgi:hypothetical protein